jgi:hypothetical protein
VERVTRSGVKKRKPARKLRHWVASAGERRCSRRHWDERDAQRAAQRTAQRAAQQSAPLVHSIAAQLRRQRNSRCTASHAARGAKDSRQLHNSLHNAAARCAVAGNGPPTAQQATLLAESRQGGAIRKEKRFPDAPRKYSSRLSDGLASTSQGRTLGKELTSVKAGQHAIPLSGCGFSPSFLVGLSPLSTR